MSEPSRREDQPLLYDSGDEESMVCSSHKWSPSRGLATSRGRAAGKMRGVASVMTKWPDHISSSIHNCWMIVFFSVLTFIVTYGVVMTVCVLPNNQFRFGRGLMNEHKKYKINPKLENIKVFCPMIVNAKEHFNLTIYVNSLKTLKQSFPKYDYNLIVLANDTEKGFVNVNNALESILSHIDVSFIETENSKDKSLVIEKHTLSTFMDSSPLKKEWRSLHKTLTPFLIKSIALWENGGITFDLKSMIENNNKTLKEEVEKVLREFSKEIPKKPISLDNIFHKQNNSNSNEIKSPKKPINNIRDVIANLEKNQSKSLSLVNLTSEESAISPTIANKIKRSLTIDTMIDEARLLFDKFKSGNRNEENKTSTSNHTNVGPSDKFKANSSSNVHTLERKNKLSNSVHTLKLEDGSNTTVINDRLPQFLKRLFKVYSDFEGKENQDNSTTTKLNILSKPDNKTIVAQKRETVSSKDSNVSALLNADIITFARKEHKNGLVSKINKESIVNAKSGKSANVGNDHKTTENHITAEPHDRPSKTFNIDENLDLILDMNGNLIATKASCHAFIGQIFSTIKKYPNLKSTKKLIDKTLKVFCHDKARSGCSGIKLLL